MAAGRLFGRKTGRRRPVFAFPRSLRITREGKWFIGVLLFIGVAAINTGNNLLYLVVATLLSIIIISGIMSESTLRGVRARRELPQRVYAGEPAVVRLVLENSKARVPSYSLRLEEPGETDGVTSTRGYVLKLEKGSERATTVRYTFTRRGRYRLDGLKVSTRFPFGIFLKGRLVKDPKEVLVYPAINRKVRPGPVPSSGESTGDVSIMGKGTGVQLYGLREYTLADDARFIHWRSAARSSKLLTKEHESETESTVVVAFDNRGAEGEVFEDAVERAASLAAAYMEGGYRVGLRTNGVAVPPGRGGETLHRILATLALIAPSAPEGPPTVRVLGR